MSPNELVELEAALVQTSERLTAPRPDECLLHYLQRMLSEFGCGVRKFGSVNVCVENMLSHTVDEGRAKESV